MITQTFHGITPERWQSIKALLAKEGITIASDASTEPQSHMGVKYEWSWDGAALTFTVDGVSWGDKLAGDTEQVVMAKFSAWISGVQ